MSDYTMNHVVEFVRFILLLGYSYIRSIISVYYCESSLKSQKTIAASVFECTMIAIESFL